MLTYLRLNESKMTVVVKNLKFKIKNEATSQINSYGHSRADGNPIAFMNFKTHHTAQISPTSFPSWLRAFGEGRVNGAMSTFGLNKDPLPFNAGLKALAC